MSVHAQRILPGERLEPKNMYAALHAEFPLETVETATIDLAVADYMRPESNSVLDSLTEEIGTGPALAASLALHKADDADPVREAALCSEADVNQDYPHPPVARELSIPNSRESLVLKTDGNESASPFNVIEQRIQIPNTNKQVSIALEFVPARQMPEMLRRNTNVARVDIGGQEFFVVAGKTQSWYDQ